MYFPVFSHKQVHCFLNLRSTIFYMTYAMHNTSIFSCIMAVISNFTNFYNFELFIFNFFFLHFFFLFVCFLFLHFHMIFATLLLINPFFSFYNQLISLRAFLRIHKAFSYNLNLCLHHACFLCF